MTAEGARIAIAEHISMTAEGARIAIAQKHHAILVQEDVCEKLAHPNTWSEDDYDSVDKYMHPNIQEFITNYGKVKFNVEQTVESVRKCLSEPVVGDLPATIKEWEEQNPVQSLLLHHAASSVQKAYVFESWKEYALQQRFNDPAIHVGLVNGKYDSEIHWVVESAVKKQKTQNVMRSVATRAAAEGKHMALALLGYDSQRQEGAPDPAAVKSANHGEVMTFLAKMWKLSSRHKHAFLETVLWNRVQNTKTRLQL